MLGTRILWKPHEAWIMRWPHNLMANLPNRFERDILNRHRRKISKKIGVNEEENCQLASMEIYLLASAWAAYFFVHSFLAATHVKKWVENEMPKAFPYYRIGYNFIAFSSLLPLLYWSISAPNATLNLPDWYGYLGAIFIALGLYLLIRAFQAFDGAEFLGLKEESTPILVQKGMYQYVRHPLYLATIVLIFGLFLCLPTQKMGLTLLISYTYIGIGYRLEERKLIAIFGDEYRVYQQRVKALIPYIL